MCWVEAKWRRSVERAEKLQEEEVAKIIASRQKYFEELSQLSYDNYGVSYEKVKLSYIFLSNETESTDYSSDTYRLAKEKNVIGRIVKLVTLSPTMLREQHLNPELAHIPATDKFATACKQSPLLKEIIDLSYNYKYHSFRMTESVMPYGILSDAMGYVRVVFKHQNCFSSGFNVTMDDDLPALTNMDFDIICVDESTHSRTLFLVTTKS